MPLLVLPIYRTADFPQSPQSPPTFTPTKKIVWALFNILREDDKSDRDNHSNQLNDNNDAYWTSRGHDSRPDDWDDRD